MEQRDRRIGRTILRRRLTALALAVAAGALVWFLIGAGDEDSGPGAPALTPAVVSPESGALLEELDTEQKVRELVLGAVEPGEPSAPLSGAVLIDAESWPGASAGADYVAAIRAAASAEGARLPLLVATRQEGGVYRELADLPPNEREIEIGDLGDPQRAQAWGEQTAEALAAVGFDLNLGPVADVASLSSPIADRAFSDDPGVAATMTAAATRGCRRGGIDCAPAHFPGLGGASQDTDSGPAIVSVDRATLLARDLAPFVAAFEGGAPAVVVSNALYAAYDGVTPASLLPEVLDGLLRGELGFEGVAITDDLEAGAIRSGSSVPEAAVSGIAAGADMVQVGDPGSVEPTLRALTAAVAAGEIPAQRLDDAAARVLELKRGLGLVGG